MNRIKKIMLILIIATALVFTSAMSICVFAEENTEPTQTAETGTETGETGGSEELTESNTETGESGENNAAESTETEETESISESFLEYLKTVYPSNYETYYNAIIDGWGSVEAYLLSIELEDEESQNSWETFVNWLNEYASVWATILAVCAALVYAYFQYRRTAGYKNQYSTLTEASNQQSKALLAVIAAQKTLLGNNEKFSEQAAALEEAEKELNKDV